MGMVAPTLVDVTLAGVDAREAGAASAVLNTAMELGGAIGVAVIGVIFFHVVAADGYVVALRDSLWFEVGVYLLSVLAMLFLPKHAVAHGELPAEAAAGRGGGVSRASPGL